jgi:C4-dicarboxylate transporter DctM subunit
MLFAGMSGSSGAAASSIGAMMIPSMKLKGYSPEFAAVVTAAGSVIGPIIPPSIAMVMYCSITGYSTGRVFLGGILPGILIGALLMLVAYFQCKKRGFAPTQKAPIQEVASSFRAALSAMLMPVIIVGGILSGIFTATEAGAVGAFYGLFIGLLYREVGIRDLPKILLNTGKTTAKVMFVISSAMLFGWILASIQLTQKLTAWLFSVSDNPTTLFFLILGFLFVLGCFMVDAAIITLCTPLFIPVIKSTGIDPIQFGVVMCMMTTTGGITPPVGNLLFIACGIGDVSFVRALRYLTPFLTALLASIVICTVFPPIVTFIPNLFLGE